MPTNSKKQTPSNPYNPQEIESRWQKFWEDNQLFQQSDEQDLSDAEKIYLLVAFPYPSGSGLHVGHVESKTAQDILARYYRMQGKKVFFPIGWDAFGLPAENYAVKTGVPPAETTKKAIDNFRRQIKRLAISYDWANEIATCHPGYYQWTQWIFSELYRAGLAYQADGTVNWCPSCQTVLANEQVVDGHCERCGHEVEQKEMRQWFFKITDYKDELISGLDQVDWPEATKQQQVNWIGKKEGVTVEFGLARNNIPDKLKKPTKKNSDSNYAFDYSIDLIKKVIKKWYLQYFSERCIYSPVLDDEVWFSRSLWNHLLEEKTRRPSELLFRFFAVPKIFQVLESDKAIVYLSKKPTPAGDVTLWSFEECVDDVSVKVVVRQLKGGDKHVYSVIWKGESKEKFEKRRQKWLKKQKKDAKKHLSSVKKLSHTSGKAPQRRQGLGTLQLLREEYISRLEKLSRLFDAIPLNPHLNEEFVKRLENLNKSLGESSGEVKLPCFTTRLDTIFGASFVVVSPEKFQELDLIQQIPQGSREKIEKYIKQAFKKTEEERKIGEKDKTGVDTGLKAVNQVNGEKISLFVADYVLAGYGTGIVMGVPAHDERDWAFAKKHGLSIKQVIEPHSLVKGGSEYSTDQWDNRYADYGKMVNSGEFDGNDFQAGQRALLEKFPQVMSKTTTYKLRDWLISRQRYWGAPIPVLYDPDGEPHLVKDEHLPWLLPTDVDFKPTGESPLTSSQEFQARTEQYAAEHYADLIKEKGWDKAGKGWRPEYDTMDTFVCSSWYYMRYVDSRDTSQFATKEKLQKWLPVDFYMIGPEHIVLHLLYSRFFTKFLRDQGYLKFDEPFMKMRHQGMILGPDHKKMSKSKGNVINPDDVVEKFGADTLRMYEMFMGPIEADKPWDVSAVAGVYRFLSRVHKLAQQVGQAEKTSPNLEQKLHQTIKKVTKDLPNLKFNTAIASMMEFVNAWDKAPRRSSFARDKAELSREDLRLFVKTVAPFAPFLAEELYQDLAGRTGAQVNGRSQDQESKTENSIHTQAWPEWDEKLAREETATIVVQINGKVRGELQVPVDQLENKAEILAQAKALPRVKTWVEGKELNKEIYVPGRIVSLVVGN